MLGSELRCFDNKFTIMTGTDWFGIIMGTAGTIGTFIFGYISLKQKSAIAGMRIAVRAYAQSEFNAWWYVGTQSEKFLKGQTVSEMHLHASEINGISHTSRSQIIAFSRGYAGAVPIYEAAWNPNPM